MKALPASNKSTPPDFGSDTISTPFGEIIISRGGFFSRQIYDVKISPLYAVDPNNTRFIIKLIGWGNIKDSDKIKSRDQPTPIKEIQDLNLTKQELGATFKKLERENPFFPKIALHNTTFYYFDTTGRKNYLTVLPIAQGISAKKLTENLTPSSTKLDDIMTKIGRALGEFHYNLASEEQKNNLSSTSLFNNFKTITHGDFHLGNVLIDMDTISFIDNASIAESLRDPQSPFIDIIRLYSIFLYLNNPNKSTQIFSTIKHSFLSFIQGYIEAYPTNERELIRKSILNMLEKLDHLVKENALRIINNQSVLGLSLPADYDQYGYKRAFTNILSRFRKLFESTFNQNLILKNLEVDFYKPISRPNTPLFGKDWTTLQETTDDAYIIRLPEPGSTYYENEEEAKPRDSTTQATTSRNVY
jgi:tRNA A-37 threonylcarbamoyl transferase component Bud32